MASFFSVVQTVIVLILVITLANITLKYVNKHMNNHNKIIKVVERVTVNNNSSLSVVDICGTYYLMSFTGADNKILKELDTSEVEHIVEEIRQNQQLTVDKSLNINLSDIKKIIHNTFGMRKKS